MIQKTEAEACRLGFEEYLSRGAPHTPYQYLINLIIPQSISKFVQKLFIFQTKHNTSFPLNCS